MILVSTEILILLILSVLDIVLTYYLFSLDKKIGNFNINNERNWLPRIIMGKEASWKRLPLSLFINLICLYLIAFISIKTTNNFNFIYIGIGILIMTNYIHFHTYLDIRTEMEGQKII